MAAVLGRKAGLRPQCTATELGLVLPSASRAQCAQVACARTSGPAQACRSLQHPGQRRSVAAQGIRRSPVIAPDIEIGHGDEAMSMDLFKYLLSQRIVFIAGYINDKMATQIVGALLALEAMDEEEDIRMYINSPGGSPYAILGVLDTMESIKPDIQTVALGACYSYSSLLLSAGTKGKRYAMKNTRVMMTQPMGGSQGDIYQIKKTVEELNALYQLFCRFYMKHTGMSQDRVEENTCRDFFMTPEMAQREGLIDGVIVGKGDRTTPPDVVKKYVETGLIDSLTPGPYVKVNCE